MGTESQLGTQINTIFKKEILYFQKNSDLTRIDCQCLIIDGNYWKWLYKVYKCFQLAKNGRKWQEMAENGLEIDEKG